MQNDAMPGTLMAAVRQRRTELSSVRTKYAHVELTALFRWEQYTDVVVEYFGVTGAACSEGIDIHPANRWAEHTHNAAKAQQHTSDILMYSLRAAF